MIQRGEKAGLGVAVAGHIVLFGLLSVGFLATPNPMKLKSVPVDISLVDDVALESAAPQTTEAPAQSIAPDAGKPEDAPPPSEAVAEPAPPTPAPAPAPPPKPSEVSRPEKVKPAPARPEPKKPAPAKAEAKPAPKPSKPAETPSKTAGSDKAAKASKPRASLLGDDILKGISPTASKGKAETPRAANVSAAAVAGIGDAIRRQVQPCANRISSPGPGANQITSKLRIQMNKDGTLAARPQLRGQSGTNSENQRYAQRVAELAMSAIIACAPYQLPADLYEGGWKDIIINYKLPD